MTLTPDGYIPRMIDPLIEEKLRISGAVCIEGPKHCGKTWASLNHANSAMMIGDSLTADIVGAASVGMRSCWIKKCAPDKIPDYVDLHIDDIRLLPDLLKTL